MEEGTLLPCESANDLLHGSCVLGVDCNSDSTIELGLVRQSGACKHRNLVVHVRVTSFQTGGRQEAEVIDNFPLLR